MRTSPLFRFTIRDVLWLMVVVAVLCGSYRNSVTAIGALEVRCGKVWDQFFAGMGPPLMGSRTAPPEE
jgi:hypothetical protein